MKYNNLGACRTIDEYVGKKLAALNLTDRTFADLFAFMFSEKDAVLYERSMGYKIVKTTYGEAHHNAKIRASALKKALPNAPFDSVIGIYMENGVEWIETFWAVLAAGFRPLLLNLRLDPAILESALSDCKAVAVIADKGSFSLPTLSPASLADSEEVENQSFGSQIFVMSTGTSNNVKICGYGAKEFASLVSDSAYIIRECSQIKRHYKGDLKLLVFLPFYHVFGLIAMYIWFAFFARTFVHLENLEPQTILSTVRRHEVTHIFAVPLFWERVYDTAERTIAKRGEATLKKYKKGLAIGEKLEKFPALAKAFRRKAFAQVREQIFGESIQFMITGGSPIREDALAFFNNIGYHLVNGYGMSEIGITSVELSMDVRRIKSGSVGKPLPSISYRIGENGALEVRGKSLACSILQGGVLSERGDDWFQTGDLAECRDNTYYILGRCDDLILLANGEMLNPNLIEPSFLFGGIAEACLVKADVPTLLLALDRSTTASELEVIRAQVTQTLKDRKLDTQIKNVVFVRGSMLGENDFKLNRTKLAARYQNGELTDISSAHTVSEASSDLERQVASIFATALGCEVFAIGMDSDFFTDADGSSLDYFAMLSVLKDTFSLPFSEDGSADFHTVRGICRYIEENDHAS